MLKENFLKCPNLSVRGCDYRMLLYLPKNSLLLRTVFSTKRKSVVSKLTLHMIALCWVNEPHLYVLYV